MAGMNVGRVLALCRSRAGWSLRRLGERAETSHATLSAYEHGRVSPTIDTLVRIAAAAGQRLEVAMAPLVADPVERGLELEAVLDLAEQFPARHDATLRMPVFGPVDPARRARPAA